jgi:glycosyltransferase involved in cell wall biosynthesis
MILMKKSILIVNPNYHYSFALRDELRARGWVADIYVNSIYPKQLLFSEDVIYEATSFPFKKNDVVKLVWRLLFFIKIIFKYKYIYVYGDAEVILISRSFSYIVRYLIKSNFSPELSILKIFRKKIIFFPNGCHQEVLKKDFSKYENGKVCGNCIVGHKSCNDKQNQLIFDKVNRYHDFVVANTPMISKSLPQKQQIYDRFVNLNTFNPNIKIPLECKLTDSHTVRILHGFVDSGRTNKEKNIKGSNHIFNAVERLKTEGFAVELIYLNNIPSKKMRYYQVQADIIIDQLVYGWWGSSAIEAMCLGKPIICYLNEGLKNEFLKAFPQYQTLPVIEANTDNIYNVIKKLVSDKNFRDEAGVKARAFAENHFDAKKNTDKFISLLNNL